MEHDFTCDDYEICKKDKTQIKQRKISDGSPIPITECSNYEPNNAIHPIGELRGLPNDCCTGFMDYGSHPYEWSECSVRFFEKEYVARGWNQCMNKGNLFTYFLIHT